MVETLIFISFDAREAGSGIFGGKVGSRVEVVAVGVGGSVAAEVGGGLTRIGIPSNSAMYPSQS